MSVVAVRRLGGFCLKRVLFNTRRHFSEELKDCGRNFDVSVLRFLVCPLSKKHLRYNKKTNELINEELGIAYPIIDGIPNMIPQEAQLIKRAEGTEEPTLS